MDSVNKNITVNSRKFDNSIKIKWKVDLLKSQDSLLVFSGIFESEINHTHLGIIKPGTVSIEYFWLDKWFNIFQFLEPDGTFRNFYCNICMPPTFQDGELDYIDLDIDVIVWQDLNVEILDLDEFQTNSVKYRYPSELVLNANKALAELLDNIETGIFPFNFFTPK